MSETEEKESSGPEIAKLAKWFVGVALVVYVGTALLSTVDVKEQAMRYVQKKCIRGRLHWETSYSHADGAWNSLVPIHDENGEPKTCLQPQ